MNHPPPLAPPPAPSTGVTVDVLIPAAGRGRRMGGDVPKVFLPLGDVPVIVHTVAAFAAHGGVRHIWLAAHPDDFSALENWFSPRTAWPKLKGWVAGGAERHESVARGLEAMDQDPPDRVLIHDGARPFVTAEIISRVLEGLNTHPAVVPVVPLVDTIRRQQEGRTQVVDRAGLVRTQTPQGFRWDVIKKGVSKAMPHGQTVTDDAQIVEADGGDVFFVPGGERNLKLTTPDDMVLGSWLLAHPHWGGGG